MIVPPFQEFKERFQIGRAGEAMSKDKFTKRIRRSP